MRFGNWRGVAIALALVAAILGGSARSARAWGYTIPRVVDAVDVNTGGPYFAPPIPAGHYTKDCGAGALGHLAGCVGLVKGLFHGCGHGCGGDGCGGDGCGDPGCGGDDPCAACGGGGCGFCQGLGLLHRHGKGCGGGGGGGLCGGSGNGGGICGSQGCGPTLVSPQTPIPTAQSSPQGGFASGQCGDPGCGLKVRHFHRRGRGCSACDGNGCGICQGGMLPSGNLCGGCRGAGCGLCGGRGLCGDPGCGGNGLCGACGGRGCKLCAGVGLLKGLPGSILAKICHKGEVKYFNGPGGPVPLTPGYVPYVVTTRSPRDFFAFPPFVDVLP